MIEVISEEKKQVYFEYGECVIHTEDGRYVVTDYYRKNDGKLRYGILPKYEEKIFYQFDRLEDVLITFERGKTLFSKREYAIISVNEYALENGETSTREQKVRIYKDRHLFHIKSMQAISMKDLSLLELRERLPMEDFVDLILDSGLNLKDIVSIV